MAEETGAAAKVSDFEISVVPLLILEYVLRNHLRIIEACDLLNKIIIIRDPIIKVPILQSVGSQILSEILNIILVFNTILNIGLWAVLCRIVLVIRRRLLVLWILLRVH